MRGYEAMQRRQIEAVEYLQKRLEEVKKERDLAKHQVVTLTENTNKLEKEIERLKEASDTHQNLQWVDDTNCLHTMSIGSATEFLRLFFDEWPGGMDEVEACWRNWKARAIKLGWKHEE